METPPSSPLLAANQHLLALRNQYQATRQPLAGSEQVLETHAGKLDGIPFPPHLGWENERITAVLRARHQPTPPENQPIPASSPPPILPSSPPPPDVPPPTSSHVKVHPSLACGLFQAEQTAVGRIWFLLQHLDRAGRGWLEVAFIRQQLTDKHAPLRACGWRQLKNLLHTGQGQFWQWEGERVWLRSAAKVAAVLGVEKLVGQPVAVPVAALCSGVGEARAHLYATFHSSRNSPNPISRETLSQVTHIPARTQRAYEETARVQKQRHIAIGERYTAESVQKRAWWHGTAVFDFIDHHGRQGPEKRHYVAWHLPNSYTACHERCSRGRKRKINREIDLVNQRTRGNGFRGLKHLFHSDGAAAGQAYNRVPYHDHYWPCSRPPQASCEMWRVMAALQEG